MGGGKKRVNPRKRPVTMADVKRAKAEATCKSIILTKVVTFSALLDKGFLKPGDVKPAWDAVCYLADSLNKGYVKLQDLYDTVREEYGDDLGEEL